MEKETVENGAGRCCRRREQTVWTRRGGRGRTGYDMTREMGGGGGWGGVEERNWGCEGGGGGVGEGRFSTRGVEGLYLL